MQGQTGSWRRVWLGPESNSPRALSEGRPGALHLPAPECQAPPCGPPRAEPGAGNWAVTALSADSPPPAEKGDPTPPRSSTPAGAQGWGLGPRDGAPLGRVIPIAGGTNTRFSVASVEVGESSFHSVIHRLPPARSPRRPLCVPHSRPSPAPLETRLWVGRAKLVRRKEAVGAC